MNPLVRSKSRSLKLSIRSAILLCSVLAIAACSHTPESRPIPEEQRGEVVGGYVVHPESTHEGQVKQQRAIARKQELELRKQDKEIQDLKRQKYYNERLKQYLNRTEAGQPDQQEPVDAAEESEALGSDVPPMPEATPTPARF